MLETENNDCPFNWFAIYRHKNPSKINNFKYECLNNTILVSKKCTNNKFYFANPLLCSIIKKKGGRSHVTAIFCVWSAAIFTCALLTFALIHRQTTIHYLRFILLLISTFLMVLVSKYCKNHGPSTLKR